MQGDSTKVNILLIYTCHVKINVLRGNVPMDQKYHESTELFQESTINLISGRLNNVPMQF